MKLSKAISDKLNKLLGEKNWSIYKLSRLTGLTPNTIQSIVSCKYKDIKLSTLVEIAHAFGLSASEFIESDEFDYENLV